MTEKNKQATGGEVPSSPIQIVEADLRLPEHQETVLAMVDAYSRDAMGNAKPLDSAVRAQLIAGLQKHPTTLIFLAFDGDRPVGAAICFVGFSTFAAKPLVNIHDFVVLPGISLQRDRTAFARCRGRQSPGARLLQANARSNGQ